MRDEKDAFVQELTLKEVEYAIDTLYESGKNFWEKFDPKELEKRDLQEEKTKAREKILKKFGFKEGDDPNTTVKLTPDFKGYDILINTAETNKPKTEAVKDAVQQIIFKN